MQGENSLGASPRDGALVLAGTAVNIVLVLLMAHFPYQDVLNHLTRYVLLDRAWSGQTPTWLAIDPRPTSYIAGDMIGAGLVHLLGTAATLRVMALGPVILLPLSMYVLLRRTNPAQTGWALVGVLFTFSWYYLSGFIEFMVGLSLAFFSLALWWPRRDTPRWGPRLALAILAALLFFVHLVVPLILLAVMGVDWLLETIRDATKAKAWRRALGSRFLMLGSVTASVAVTWAVSAVLDAAPAETIAPASYRPFLEKLLAIAAPFWALTALQFAVMLGAYVLAVATLAWEHRARLLNPFALCGPAFLVMYFVTPRHVLGAGEADVRWLAPACLLPFCMPGPGSPIDRRVLTGLLTLCVLHAAVIGYYGRRIDAQLTAYDRVIAAIPAGARVLPVVADGMRYPRLSPYAYYGLWHTIRTGDQGPGLFSGTGRKGRPMPYYEHIRVRHELYEPPEVWGAPTGAPLDCSAVQADYAFIVQAGSDARLATFVRQCGVPVMQVGEITLFRTVSPP